MRRKGKKRKPTKTTTETVWGKGPWSVVHGTLKRGSGRRGKIESLFRVVAEEIPFDALDDVRRHVRASSAGRENANGVYVAHDSMGIARYIGRGLIFNRLNAGRRANQRELKYFSIYVVRNKMHEREMETLLIRAAAPQLYLNTRKKRVDIEPGNIRDYEPGTLFYERQSKRGRKRVSL